MPSGRDSFRRNRVAPIRLQRYLLRLATTLLYHPRQIARQMGVAAGPLAATLN